MIRILIDKLGSGHDDLFLKVDNIPGYSKTGDSYYLADFLELATEADTADSETLKNSVRELIQYWKQRIGLTERGAETFLPFDFQDEYVGGLLLKESSHGFSTKPVFTDKIHGYEVSKTNLDRLLKEREIQFKEDVENEWLISHERLDKGLEWTVNELKK